MARASNIFKTIQKGLMFKYQDLDAEEEQVAANLEARNRARFQQGLLDESRDAARIADEKVTIAAEERKEKLRKEALGESREYEAGLLAESRAYTKEQQIAAEERKAAAALEAKQEQRAYEEDAPARLARQKEELLAINAENAYKVYDGDLSKAEFMAGWIRQQRKEEGLTTIKESTLLSIINSVDEEWKENHVDVESDLFLKSQQNPALADQWKSQEIAKKTAKFAKETSVGQKVSKVKARDAAARGENVRMNANTRAMLATEGEEAVKDDLKESGFTTSQIKKYLKYLEETPAPIEDQPGAPGREAPSMLGQGTPKGSISGFFGRLWHGEDYEEERAAAEAKERSLLR